MDSNSNENISLPETYLQPSKKLYKLSKHSQNKQNIWKDNESEAKLETCSYLCDNNNQSNQDNIDAKIILKNQQRYLFSKELRGETPGSDAPSNSPPPLVSTGIKNNFIFSVDPPEENMEESESNNFIWASKSSTKDYSHLSQRRSVEGADSNGELLSLSSQQSNISGQDFQEIKYMQRNSPAGVSTPEVLSNTTNTDIEAATFSNDLIEKSVRPPALGQSEDILHTFIRKDLGSTDGEDSSHESTKNIQEKLKKVFVESCSVGSQSENTDSTNTVLDLQREPIQGCEDMKTLNLQSNSLLPKPNFVVGGAISPRAGLTITQKGCSIDLEKHFVSEPLKDKINSTFHLSPNQDESLTSKISFESPHPPESTECITSPSVISVSSISSSKKLEWDSSADVGYSGKALKEKFTSSLSTLERIAIGNYASVLRAEPEGKGTNHIKGLKSKPHRKISNAAKENKSSQLLEIKTGMLSKKPEGKNYYSLNYNKKGLIINIDFDKKSLCTDEETSDAKSLNSPRRKNKKAPIYQTSYCQVRKNLTKLENITCKEKASSLSELTSKIDKSNISDSLIFQANSEELLKGLTSNQNVDNKQNNNINYFDTLSLPSNNSLKIVLHASAANKNHSQSLELKKYDGNSSEKFESAALSQSHNKDNFKDPQNECSKEFTLATKMKKILDSENQTKNLTSNSVNRSLFVLSKKLNHYISSLVETGVIEKFDDYSKLQDYINFVGMPSNTEEEIKLKKSVADIILRMFGDISAQEIDSSSSTLNTDENNIESNASLSSSVSCNSDFKVLNEEGINIL